MYLSSVVGNRDNNFNLLRLLAALAVVLSHSFYVVLGGHDFEPWRTTIGSTPGNLAVDVFFVISGFLVTRSLDFRKDGVEFVCARSLRIFPGLAVNLLFVSLLIGAVYTSLPLLAYYADGGILTYVLRNLQVLVLPIPYNDLPGVTVGNGSLWTLPVEVCCYLVLLCSWLAWNRIRHRSFGIGTALAILVGALAVIRFTQTAGGHLAWMFGSGTLAYFFRHRVKLVPTVGVGVFIALLLSTFHRTTFQFVLIAVGPYLVFCAAYLPAGRIRLFNRLGDYSYGVYIYGLPVQFVVQKIAPHASVLAHFLIAAPAVIVVAAVSWHVVEKPSLRAVPHVASRVRQMLSRFKAEQPAT